MGYRLLAGVLSAVVSLCLAAAPVLAKQPATPTPTLTPTPGSSPTPALSPCNGNENEPNDSGWGCVLPTGGLLSAEVNPSGDEDWFLAYMVNDRLYRIEATAVSPGVDPILTLSRLSGETIAGTTRPPGSHTAGITIQVDVSAYYAIAVASTSIITGTYTVRVAEMAVPTATETPTVTYTPSPGPSATPWPTATLRLGEALEPNNAWIDAAELQLGVQQSKELIGGEWWALRVKMGVTYECSANSSTFDPVIRVSQNGPEPTIAYNDDDVAGKPAARSVWVNTFDGLAYIEVFSTFGSGDYSIICDSIPSLSSGTGSGSDGGGNGGVLPTRPPTSVPVAVRDATATEPAPTLTPYPTLTPTPGVRIRMIGALNEPTPVLTTLNVQIYYDLNGSKSPDPGEGVQGLSVRGLDSGISVAWGLTDENGQVTLSVVGPVDRVGVMYLNLYEKIKPGESHSVVWRVPAVQIPTLFTVLEPEQ